MPRSGYEGMSNGYHAYIEGSARARACVFANTSVATQTKSVTMATLAASASTIGALAACNGAAQTGLPPSNAGRGSKCVPRASEPVRPPEESPQ